MHARLAWKSVGELGDLRPEALDRRLLHSPAWPLQSWSLNFARCRYVEGVTAYFRAFDLIGELEEEREEETLLADCVRHDVRDFDAR